MSLLTIFFIVLTFIIVSLAITVIVLYNNLVALRNRFKNAFSQISVQMQRRYDLIPNLVESAKEYMRFEQQTLTNVINARNQAVAANKTANANPNDMQNIQTLSSADNILTKSIGGLFALVENYPDLKSNQTMQQMMEELSSTENKIAFAKQAYNDQVMIYNTACEVFPNSLIANAFNFKPAGLLELDNPEAAKRIKVSFN